jgi:nitrate reductase gamma subunit
LFVLDVLYQFELQMAGVILLTAMTIGGISLWIKRRKLNKELQESTEADNTQNF